jgi:hypothetical protein
MYLFVVNYLSLRLSVSLSANLTNWPSDRLTDQKSKWLALSLTNSAAGHNCEGVPYASQLNSLFLYHASEYYPPMFYSGFGVGFFFSRDLQTKISCSLLVFSSELHVHILAHHATWISDHVVRPDIFLVKSSQVSVFLHVCVADRVPAVPSNATVGDRHMKLYPEVSSNAPAMGKRKASHNLHYPTLLRSQLCFKKVEWFWHRQGKIKDFKSLRGEMTKHLNFNWWSNMNIDKTYYYYYYFTVLCWDLAALSVSWSYTQSVGLLGRGISPSQGRYLHAEQHKHRINARRHLCLEWDSNLRSQYSRRRKTVHALDRAATVMGRDNVYNDEFRCVWSSYNRVWIIKSIIIQWPGHVGSTNCWC